MDISEMNLQNVLEGVIASFIAAALIAFVGYISRKRIATFVKKLNNHINNRIPLIGVSVYEEKRKEKTHEAIRLYSRNGLTAYSLRVFLIHFYSDGSYVITPVLKEKQAKAEIIEDGSTALVYGDIPIFKDCNVTITQQYYIEYNDASGYHHRFVISPSKNGGLKEHNPVKISKRLPYKKLSGDAKKFDKMSWKHDITIK